MSLEVFTQFNKLQQPIASQQIGMTTTMPSLIDTEPDFFETHEGKSATSAGIILAVGMAARGFLKNLSDGFFAKYFSKNQNIDEEEIKNIALNMIKDKKLMQTPEVFTTSNSNLAQQLPEAAEAWFNKKDTIGKLDGVFINHSGQDAFFTAEKNFIKVTKETLISLPHEIGHAIEEHSTNILKKLQRSRGQYAALALFLYGLGREKPANENGRQSLFDKIQNTLYKYNILIPLLAYAPELITEFTASKIGIDYIKKHINNLKTDVAQNAKSIEKSQNILKVAKKHYAIAFCTYLSLPLFAVLDNYIFKKATKN